MWMRACPGMRGKTDRIREREETQCMVQAPIDRAHLQRQRAEMGAVDDSSDGLESARGVRARTHAAA